MGPAVKAPYQIVLEDPSHGIEDYDDLIIYFSIHPEDSEFFFGGRNIYMGN
jgi:hypothetical protein